MNVGRSLLCGFATIAVCYSMTVQAQNPERLQALKKQFDRQDTHRQQVLNRVVDSLGYPRKLILANKTAVLTDFVDGIPYYSAAHNAQARRTTGVEYIQSPDGLNLPLNGQGMTVGVWDEGFVRHTHVEFGNRVTNMQGTDFGEHSTHVTGTIAASGINPQAKGMMPQAKVNAYYAFDNDLSSMAAAAADGLILSNHSYGLLLGWEFDNGTWKWFGGSNNIDQRFGHYSAESKALDDIARNAPYYTIVRSAGNDRSDSGDGSRPPDGPYDCIGPSAVAKNVITVGAITGFDEYSGPESAKMSTFSSWGPTDDGRIKPDIVADGVGVFSTSFSGDQSYTTLQGTSMAAPNVTGSLGLLQQLFAQTADTFMTSAALKSLVIHTAREAGVSEGPDYSFGWGVLNVIDAYLILRDRNDRDTLLIENALENGNTHEYTLVSDGKSPIVATIAWTDISASLAAEGSPNRRLVNDLDIRLVDYKGNEIRPWTLNPVSPTAKALRADNDRDNVEKIELGNPAPGSYTLRVSHKNTLTGGIQTYGLVLTGSSINAAETTIYWASGEGITNGSNWSESSGGAPEPIIANDKSWVFDDNSPLEDNYIIQMEGNTSIKNLLWLTSRNAVLDLDGDTLFVEHEIISTNKGFKIRNGVVVLKAVNADAIYLDYDGSDQCTVMVQNSMNIWLRSDVKLDRLLVYGDVSLESKNLFIEDFEILPGASFHVENSNIHVNHELSVRTADLVAFRNNWFFDGALIDFLEPAALAEDSLTFLANSTFVGVGTFKGISLNGELIIDGLLTAEHIGIEEGSTVLFPAAGQITALASLVVESSAQNNTTISGLSASQPGTILIDYRQSICMDFLNLENLNIETQSVVNIGLNSTTTNVAGIVAVLCEDLIFPDFALSTDCANSVIKVQNTSLGEIDEYVWDFETGVFMNGIDDVTNPAVVFDTAGFYTIKLTIRKGDLEVQYEKVVEISPNDIAPIKIITLENSLVASVVTSEYVWYHNGLPLPNVTDRTLTPELSGSYRVSYAKAGHACGNRISKTVEFDLITAVEEKPNLRQDVVQLYPNPVSSQITITGLEPNDEVSIRGAKGELYRSFRISGNASQHVVDLERFPPGVLFMVINRKSAIYSYRVIKR